MKTKLTLFVLTAAAVCHVSAAQYLISNVQAGDSSDTLFQNADGTLLSGGTVALGYFTGGLPSTSISNISIISGAFVTLASSPVGGNSLDLEGSFAGYVQAAQVAGAFVGLGDPLIGQGVYIFAGNGANLNPLTLDNPTGSNEWALGFLTNFAADVPLEQVYVGNPTGVQIIGDIGALGTFTGDIGFGSGTYNTFQVVPEPSAALLGALGALGLLRRRRI